MNDREGGTPNRGEATLGWDHHIRRSDRVVFVAHAGAGALIDLQGGLRITLDPFGTHVWTLLADRPTLRAVVDAVSDERPTPEPLADDVRRLVTRWRELRLVTW